MRKGGDKLRVAANATSEWQFRNFAVRFVPGRTFNVDVRFRVLNIFVIVSMFSFLLCVIPDGAKPGTKAPCRRSQWIAALHRVKNQAIEEHEVIALSSDSEHEKDKNLEAGTEEALLAAEDGAEETLPKNVYAALWAMLDIESENEAEEIPGQWDLDGVLNNWGKIEPEVGPAENDQGPPPAAN
ncbi:hypothetical protein PIB30_058565 [Stylosanthes scabra]|uniref:Transmembrane protein n=1 Tax=Stylosanthes scabra TaxID=79078 RepID=A0ABU6ZIS7_9FABA|nr:hypothetical protein [Stylosanthes scabra]